MRALGVTRSELVQAACESGVALNEVDSINKGNTSYRFTIRPIDGKWQRVSPRGRKVHAVCWHGHLEFMRYLYRINSTAKIRTAMSRYDSREDLESNKGNAYHSNIGSLTYPMDYGDACNCDGITEPYDEWEREDVTLVAVK